MKILLAAVVLTLLAGPAFAQAQTAVPRAGESTGKSDKEIRDEKDADQAYQKSLGNIPAQKAADPWGIVRSDNAPKAAAKVAPAKRAKTGEKKN